MSMEMLLFVIIAIALMMMAFELIVLTFIARRIIGTSK